MRTRLLLLSIAALAVAGCQQSQAGGTTERLAPEPLVEPIDPTTDPVAAVNARKHQMAEQVNLVEMRAEVLSLIGDAAADAPAQCKVVPYGAKPCGGPAGYLAYSSKNGNEREILALIDKYTAAQRSENARLGLMSDCAIVPKPEVVLENGVCKLAPAGSGAVF